MSDGGFDRQAESSLSDPVTKSCPLRRGPLLLTFQEIGVHVVEDILPATESSLQRKGRCIPEYLFDHDCCTRGRQAITPEGWRSVGLGAIAEALCRAFRRSNSGIGGACHADMPIPFARRRIDAVGVAVAADMRLLDID